MNETMSQCPNCGVKAEAGAAECPACGIIFSKWKSRQERAETGQAAATGSVNSPKDVPGSDESLSVAWGAVVKGAVAGGVASFIESMVVAMPFMSGTPHTQAEAEAMVKALMLSNKYLMTDLAASLFCMALGGWVAAGSAGHSGAKHGAITGVILLCVIGVTALVSSQLVPAWYTAAVLILIVPAAALGGKIR